MYLLENEWQGGDLVVLLLWKDKGTMGFVNLDIIFGIRSQSEWHL
jgi:hypothetical protein